MNIADKSNRKFKNPGFIGVLGGKDAISRPIHSEFDLILLSNEGITKQSLESLISYLGISKKAFSENILDASVKTLERKKSTDKLGKHTSSLAIEIAKVVEHALDVFEDEEKIFGAIKAGANGCLLKKHSPQKILDAVAAVAMENRP